MSTGDHPELMLPKHSAVNTPSGPTISPVEQSLESVCDDALLAPSDTAGSTASRPMPMLDRAAPEERREEEQPEGTDVPVETNVARVRAANAPSALRAVEIEATETEESVDTKTDTVEADALSREEPSPATDAVEEVAPAAPKVAPAAPKVAPALAGAVRTIAVAEKAHRDAAVALAAVDAEAEKTMEADERVIATKNDVAEAKKKVVVAEEAAKQATRTQRAMTAVKEKVTKESVKLQKRATKADAVVEVELKKAIKKADKKSDRLASTCVPLEDTNKCVGIFPGADGNSPFMAVCAKRPDETCPTTFEVERCAVLHSVSEISRAKLMYF